MRGLRLCSHAKHNKNSILQFYLGSCVYVARQIAPQSSDQKRTQSALHEMEGALQNEKGNACKEHNAEIEEKNSAVPE